jgi:hypothetical protein
MRKEKIKGKVDNFTNSAAEKIKPAYNKVRSVLPFDKEIQE